MRICTKKVHVFPRVSKFNYKCRKLKNRFMFCGPKYKCFPSKNTIYIDFLDILIFFGGEYVHTNVICNMVYLLGYENAAWFGPECALTPPLLAP